MTTEPPVGQSSASANGQVPLDPVALAAEASLSVPVLSALAAKGEIETVLVVAPDMLGRLVGKRYTVTAFLDHVVEEGAAICEYVLDRDVEMQPYEHVWDGGFSDGVLRPDLATLRRAAWLERSAIVICDIIGSDGEPMATAPRQILRRQLERLAERGWSGRAASELEFILFRTPLEQARSQGYRDLRPATDYNTDYNTFATTMVEDVMAPIRRALAGSGLIVEDCKGESHPGQMEINVRFAEAMRMADDHMLFKEAAKVVAWRHGCALTFMPKFSEREGNSCHVHFSLWDGETPLFAIPPEQNPVFRSFLAGQLQYSRELCYLFAQNVNSYKRFAHRSFAPIGVTWGEDNRTCGLRVLGNSSGRRVESRIPGGDCNPYLAFAAIAAMGLYGIDHQLEPPPPYQGDAYAIAGESQLPTNLTAALQLFAASEFAREAFGDVVVDHYLQAGWAEQRSFDAAVTDWDLARSFERL
jgi:glutamine synthetase